MPPETKPNELSVEIAASLREVMARRKVTQVMLTEKVNISSRQLVRLLNAQRRLGLEQFVEICHALGVSAPAVLALAETVVRERHDRGKLPVTR